MKILVRYVLFELIKVFTIVLIGLTLLIFIGLMGQQAVSKGLGLGPLLRMTPYLLPQSAAVRRAGHHALGHHQRLRPHGVV